MKQPSMTQTPEPMWLSKNTTKNRQGEEYLLLIDSHYFMGLGKTRLFGKGSISYSISEAGKSCCSDPLPTGTAG